MKKRLVIVEGRGSGEIAMSVFEAENEISNQWIVEGFLNDIVPKGQYFAKYKVLGGTHEFVDFINRGYYIHYTLHLNAKKKK